MMVYNNVWVVCESQEGQGKEFKAKFGFTGGACDQFDGVHRDLNEIL